MAEPPEERPLNVTQSQALWWAKFIRDYGVSALSGVLLGVFLGLIPSPIFTGAKVVETETRDAVGRMESNSGVVLMRLEVMNMQIVTLFESLDRVTCVMMLTADQRKTIHSRTELDAQCLWLRGIGHAPMTERMP